MAQKQKPVHRIRIGSVKAAIWANSNQQGEAWYNVTISRLYKDGNTWKDTSTFSRDDLPIAAKAADMAYAWIWEQEVNASSSEQAGE